MNPENYEDAFIGQVVTIGELCLPTGRIVACDPYFCADAMPYSRIVARGRHSVQLRVVASPEWGRRVALARVLLEPRVKAITFEPAVTAADRPGSYFVDSGTGSFMDESARESFTDVFANFYRSNRQGNYYTDVLASEFKKSAINPTDSADLGLWTLHRLPKSELNVAIFSSGLGDGAYQSFWGLDRNGIPVSLVTDFRIL